MLPVQMKVGSVLRFPWQPGWTVVSGSPATCSAVVSGNVLVVTALAVGSCTITINPYSDVHVGLSFMVSPT